MAETDIIVLPEIKDAKKELESQFSFYRNTTKKNSVKNKILLHYNLISLLRSGEKILSYADKTTIITNDHFAILSSGNCLMSEKVSKTGPYESLLFLFNDSALSNFLIKYAAIIDGIKNKADTLGAPFIVLKKDVFIENFCASLLFLFNDQSSISKEILQVKFEELMLYLLQKNPSAILDLQTMNQDEFSDFKIKEVVEKNLTQNITLNELSFLCNTSISTFKRRFVKLYNESPSHYFLRRKMNIAAQLLQKKENPSEVFSKIGYENYSSFSQSFKQIYGVSPRQYKQKN